MRTWLTSLQRSLKWTLFISILTIYNQSDAWSIPAVTPSRIVFTDRQRSNEVSIKNTSDQPKSYLIRTIFYRIKPDGGLKLEGNPTPDERSGAKFLRYSPQRVTLPPGVEQVVRVFLMKPPNLAAGHYRAHIFFEEVLSEDFEAKATKVKLGNNIGASINVKMSLAIPVIIKHGKVEGEVKLSSFLLTKNPEGQPVIKINIDKKGLIFPYGTLFAYSVAQDGTPTEIGVVKGVSVYEDHRTVAITLDSKKYKPAEGKLRVEFHTTQEEGNSLIASFDSK